MQATLETQLSPELAAAVRAGRVTLSPILFPDYQKRFLASIDRYPALIAGIGTGKTRMALQKMHKYCEETPQSLWIVVRKEFRDLQDSTMPDFEKYFGVKINSSRNYDYPNGSRIMFRHGEEVESGMNDPNVLKNINLSGFFVEQVEEFMSNNVFIFLRDRLRRDDMPYHQGIVIGNVKGHNWVFKTWKQHQVANPAKYPLFEATTFENERNLPKDFIDDLKDMELDAPAHYRRYVLNDWDEEEGFDVLIARKLIERSYTIEGFPTGGKMLICDPARFGDAETALAIIQRIDEKRYAQTMGEEHKGWDTMRTTGRIVQILQDGSEYAYESPFDCVIIDGNGLGGGVVDRLFELKDSKELKELMKDTAIISYNGGEKAVNTKKYVNCRAEDTWTLKDILESQSLRLLEDDKQADQICTLQFDYRSNGQRYILSKEDMRKKGLPSPDRADRIIMGARHLSILRAARPQLSPQAAATKEFWELVNRDKEKANMNSEEWHNVE